MFKQFGIVRSYTLEANYYGGKVVNEVLASGLPEKPEADSSSAIYANGPPRFSEAINEELGKALGVTLVDCLDKNPHSRLTAINMSFKEFRVEAAMSLARKAPYNKETAVRKASFRKEKMNAYLAFKQS